MYDPANPNFSDLATIEPDKGYYIYMTQDATLAVIGTVISADRQVALEPGWNLIGWTTIEERPASDALSSLASDPQHVAWGLDEKDATDPWKFYASGESGSDLVSLEPGEGYWVHVSNAANITVPAPAEQEYHYDSQGRRLGSAVIYDGENQIAKYDDLGNLLVSYFQGPGIDNPISMTRDGQTYYYHTDALGSVMELTNASRNIAQSYRYDAFGTIIQQSGNVQNPFTYTGRELDKETGLYHFRARYYDPFTGRFLSRDPLLSFGESYQIFKKSGMFSLWLTNHKTLPYVYVGNNSLNLTDPMGLSSFVHKCCMTACGLGCILFCAGDMIPDEPVCDLLCIIWVCDTLCDWLFG